MKIPMSINAIKKPFPPHQELKRKLLTSINREGNIQSLGYKEESNDNSKIRRLDWNNAKDLKTRKWVNILLPDLQGHFDDLANSLGYEFAEIEQLWFQQYIQNDNHPWHVHSSNYTGVYYLEFPQGSPPTQIIDHNDKLYTIDAKEGDLIIFPSFLIHRSPNVDHKIRKTIISFNIDFYNITKDMGAFE